MASLPKRPRLPRFSYRGLFAYSITLAAHNRNQYFREGEIVELLRPILEDCCRDLGFTLHGYCFMPDHLHLLVQGLSEQSDLRQFLTRFKQVSGYRFKALYGKRLWQPSYYDHVLRKGEEIQTVVRYILFNPVRAGLVDDFRKYPYSGSRYLK